MPRVSGLFIYPVKSLRGCAVPALELDALGPAGDRRFLVIDEAGKFLTQRTLPRMALIATALAPGTLTLAADGAGTVTVATASDSAAPLHRVTVWKSEGLLAEDCGDAAAAWLGGFLATSCRLVRIGRAFHRPVLKKAAHQGDEFTFADGAPLLVISEASLADLNDRIQEAGGEPVPMNRFRPNLVLTGCPAFAEDAWAGLQIGAVRLRSAGPSSRCIVTTTDQLTGERGREPLRTLAGYRRDTAKPADINFGVNFINESKSGRLRLGDEAVPF